MSGATDEPVRRPAPRRRAARWLVACHRWLGIALGALFVLWFASGIVLMWRGMPGLSRGERLVRRAPLELSDARVDPAEAAAAAGIDADTLTVAMLGSRPVYRLGARGVTTTVFADTGEPFPGFDEAGAVEAARRHLGPGDGAKRLRYAGMLDRPDQWTLQERALLPFHRVTVDDGRGTVIYLSDRTGEVELVTTRSSRSWGYAGAVVHWLYYTPLRRHGAIWLQTVIWLSVAGLALCASGLAWGVWTWVRRRRSPYTGWLRWHHVTGLLFGVLTFTWTLSGLLSLDPWSWHPGTRPTPRQAAVIRGGELGLRAFEVDRLRAGLAALRGSLEPRELAAGRFRGDPWLLARSPENPTRRAVAWLGSPATAGSDPPPAPPAGSGPAGAGRVPRGPGRERLVAAAEAAVPGAGLAEVDLLGSYDAYYYDRAGARPLPVLRVRFADPSATALYLDALTGEPVHREQRLTRWNRWLYHGLHSWDHPALLARPRLREGLMVMFLLGGLLAAATAAAPGCRRLARSLRRTRSGGARPG